VHMLSPLKICNYLQILVHLRLLQYLNNGPNLGSPDTDMLACVDHKIAQRVSTTFIRLRTRSTRDDAQTLFGRIIWTYAADQMTHVSAC